MSRLDDLIQKMCPCGIETIYICDIADYEQPTKYIVESTDYNDNFETPVLTAGQTFILGYTNETNGIYEASKNHPVIIFDDFTGAFKWVDFPFKVKSSAIKIITAKDNVSIRYLYHLMGFLNYTSTEHKRLWISVYSKFKVALPPMEVQQEIVRLLDEFTEKTAELQNKLNEELEARKKQYEYYKDNLLNRHKKVNNTTIGNIAESVTVGIANSATHAYRDKGIVMLRNQNIKENYLDDSDLIYIDENFSLKYNNKILKENDILVTRTGYPGQACIVPKQYEGAQTFTTLILRLKDVKITNPKYVCYYINSASGKKYVQKMQSGAAQQNFGATALTNMPIPIPNIETQNRLVEVFDHFDSICSDLNIGLPDEIEARQKQYEYYRDSLLTFAETGSIMPQTDRQTDRQAIIRLIQYVFGYVNVKLSDIATQMYRGNGIKRDQVKAEGYPCVRYGELYTEYGISFEKCVSHTNENLINNPKYIEHGDILFAITGESVEDIGKSTAYTGKEKCLVGGDILVMKHNQNPKYLSYVLSTEESRKQKSKGKIKSKVVHTNAESIGNIEIPLPSLEKQAYLVEILDNFENICNNLQSGLPAEIEARQRQYEYYRDKLLTFNELK